MDTGLKHGAGRIIPVTTPFGRMAAYYVKKQDGGRMLAMQRPEGMSDAMWLEYMHASGVIDEEEAREISGLKVITPQSHAIIRGSDERTNGQERVSGNAGGDGRSGGSWWSGFCRAVRAAFGKRDTAYW